MASKAEDWRELHNRALELDLATTEPADFDTMSATLNEMKSEAFSITPEGTPVYCEGPGLRRWHKEGEDRVSAAFEFDERVAGNFGGFIVNNYPEDIGNVRIERRRLCYRLDDSDNHSGFAVPVESGVPIEVEPLMSEDPTYRELSATLEDTAGDIKDIIATLKRCADPAKLCLNSLFLNCKSRPSNFYGTVFMREMAWVHVPTGLTMRSIAASYEVAPSDLFSVTRINSGPGELAVSQLAHTEFEAKLPISWFDGYTEPGGRNGQ